jgi:hypothetical protein
MSEGIFEPVEEMVEKIGEDVTDLVFNPRPGGMVDRWQREKARKEAAAKDRENEAERVEGPSYKAVKTTQQTPEVVSTNLITIQPGAIALILPNSPYRYRASLLVVTTASSVILSKDQGTALGGIGFPLPSGIIMVLQNRAQLWGYNSGGSAIQVAALAEIYAPEK